MFLKLKILCTSSFLPLSLASASVPPPSEPPPGMQNVQQMSIQAPTMTEEDQYGFNMPHQYKCSACRAVLWHVNNTFESKLASLGYHSYSTTSSRSQKSSTNKKHVPKEWELEDLVNNNLCAETEYEGYGIKLRDGANVLNGRGLSHEDQALEGGMASIQMGSESWRRRMSEECRKLISGGELFNNDDDEDESDLSPVMQIYNLWNSNQIDNDLCYNNKRYCGNEKKALKEKQKQQKEKALKKQKAAEKARKKDNKLQAKAEKKITLESYVSKMASKMKVSGLKTEKEWEKEMKGIAGCKECEGVMGKDEL